ncbi:signal peptidase I [Gordonia malaquae]|jgi:signal peptidase|uniref:signal peptidase I n=1 Tax=Gordonia malaquae TaxID=410332 RepID=UPI0030C79D24
MTRPDTDSGKPATRMHHVWQAVSWLLLAAAFATLCATILVPKIAGGRPYTVLTGSMRPDYPPGTLIVVKPKPVDLIEVGDVITYQVRSGQSDVITHRVVEIAHAPNGELRFITRGDANGRNDDPVRPVQVRGVLWYSIPYLGFANSWFTGHRRTITVFVLAGLLFAYGAWEFYRDWREGGDPDDDADEPPADETPTALIRAADTAGGRESS